MVSSVLFSSKKPDWETPQDLYDKLDAEFHFTLDPCSSHQNHKAPAYFTEAEDGLAQSWDGHTVFMNPPYGRGIGAWMKKASEAKATVVCLVPSRTDTAWWHEYVIAKGAEVRFIRGRLKFGGSINSAPFPSAIIVYRNLG